MIPRNRTCQILTVIGRLASLPLYQTMRNGHAQCLLKYLRPWHISCCLQLQHDCEEHPSYQAVKIGQLLWNIYNHGILITT